MPISAGYRKVQNNAVKACRKHRQHTVYRHCQLCHVTPTCALIVGVCILMLPMLELANERVQLATMYDRNHINHVHAPDLRAHPISQQCATSHGPPEQSSVVKYQMSVPLQCPLCYAQPSSHYGYGSEEEDGGGGGASTTILMSGDVEMNPGPVGGWTLLMYFEFRAV